MGKDNIYYEQPISNNIEETQEATNKKQRSGWCDCYICDSLADCWILCELIN